MARGLVPSPFWVGPDFGTWWGRFAATLAKLRTEDLSVLQWDLASLMASQFDALLRGLGRRGMVPAGENAVTIESEAQKRFFEKSCATGEDVAMLEHGS